jgi:hypothetical protein
MSPLAPRPNAPASTIEPHRPLLALGLLVFVGGCGLTGNKHERTIAQLAETGNLEARWDVREEARLMTHTLVLVRSGGNLVLWDVMRTDGYRSGNLEKAGGVDREGCFLYARGNQGIGPLRAGRDGSLLRDAARSSTSERTATDCSEYAGTPGAEVVQRARR